MTPLLIATTNRGKVAELRDLAAHYPAFSRFQILLPSELGYDYPPVAETGTTFAENAAIKAQTLCDLTGYASLADDSGLCVDALDGAPGLYSARWTGADATDTDRTQALLRALQDVPEEARTARFVCAIALCQSGQPVLQAEGVCEGTILEEPRGQGGFGYDPVFYLPLLGRSLAELSPVQKNTISHRASAMALLAELLNASLVL